MSDRSETGANSKTTSDLVVERLLEWAEQARVVVPSHGEIGGPELLRRNAAYLEGLQREPQRDVPELATADSFYKRAHQRNRRRAASL